MASERFDPFAADDLQNTLKMFNKGNPKWMIILAAGTGSRLRPYTENRPKCMVELHGKPLLEHQLDILRAAGD